jgi:uncharacterized protein YndB with AHSA1/START domain
MKILKIFVITTGSLIVLALLSLFVASRRPDAGVVSATTELQGPPATVMPWLTEPARLKQWVSSLTDVRGDIEQAAVGQRQIWTMDDGKSGALTMTIEITMYSPPDSMRRSLLVPGLVEGTNTYELTDLGGRTRLKVEGKYHHPNPLVALLEPLVAPEAKAKLRADLAKLGVILAHEALEGAGSAEGAAGAMEGGPGPGVTAPR